MNGVITLTTDFGLSDAYVAAMKGVILGINPEARIVDICHTIAPQNLLEAAYVIGTAHRFFPDRTVHVVVVDPGVGGDRRAIVLRTPQADFVAPDNGVLSHIVAAYPHTLNGGRVSPGKGVAAVSLTNSAYWRQPVSPTFHGRDIFAPVAAHLSLGVPLASLGSPVTSLSVLPLPGPSLLPGTVNGHVIHIDSFGNLITDIAERMLPADRDAIVVGVGGKRIHGLVKTYGEGEGLLALIGSNGYLEVSLKNGSASGFLGVGVSDQVRVNLNGGGKS